MEIKRQIEKTDYDCYVVINSIRVIDRGSLHFIKEESTSYYIAESYTC